MPFILPRDVELDHTLESEAQTTLKVIGTAVGAIVLCGLIILCARPIWKYFLRKMGLAGQYPNPAGTKMTERLSTTELAPPLRTMPAAHIAPLGRDQKPTDVHRQHGFFSPVRKYASTPRYSNIHIYRGAHGLHTPPAAKLATVHRPPTMPALSLHTFAAAHNAAWMDVADAVVGRHPHARPLHARVATRAEIDMISGHVHIPWAYPESDRPQPVPVKVLKPLINYPAVPPQPGQWTDVSNVGDRDVRVVNKLPSGRASPRTKKAHRARGKENMAAALPVTGSSVRARF
ncbi:hypothetical protein HYPSUDRAFT_46523 [Hypholoma sublateritium FD-334 SS-4]|uniref:Uncharacterized protein n=1 Tax=Hypholoma sublateritium (strain FD-334 SS-4) TaxID=945553 RepID=A0A0D2NE46_HYPSF|nr:hypothetical protein HYPSUDRAFT_46523 [Hypholoma sublateritium FD-334 SS-4]